MKGLSPGAIEKIIEKDVLSVEEKAIAVFEITAGNQVIYRKNKQPRLSIIAVIGPPKHCDVEVLKAVGQQKIDSFEKVLLAEIGMNRGKPYGGARGIDCELHRKYISPRREWFWLSREQYEAVAPQIFCLLFDRTCSLTLRWKTTKNYENWYIKYTKRILTHKNRWEDFKRSKQIPLGLRYSISAKNRKSFFTADLLAAAEKYKFPQIEWQKRGLVRMLDLRFTTLRREKKIFLWEDEAVRIIQMSKLSRRFICEAFSNYQEYIPKKHRKSSNGNRFFWEQLGRLYPVETLDFNKDKKSLLKGCFADRVGDLDIKITTGPDEGKRFVVFEIYPKYGEWSLTSLEEALETIPF